MTQDMFMSILMDETKKGTEIVRVKLTTTTTPKLPKYLGLGQVVKTTTQVLEVGKSYYSHINERMETRNLTGNVERESLPWGQWSAYPFIIVNKGKAYLRTYMVERCKSNDVTYVVNGHLATREEMETIHNYLSQKEMTNHKQEVVGLKKVVQVRPLNYELSTIQKMEFEDGIVIGG